jgi:hypothetical protein
LSRITPRPGRSRRPPHLGGFPRSTTSISAFDSADAALASNEIAASWIRDNVLEFTKGMPEVMAGDVLAAEIK